MSRKIDRVLDWCLRRGLHNAQEAQVPRRYADSASELGTLLRLAGRVSRSYTDVPEPPGGLEEGRQRMLSAASQLRSPATGVPLAEGSKKPEGKEEMASRVLPKLAGATLAAVLITLIVGGGVAAAAGDSLPGQALYPVKLAVEDVRLALASSPEAEAELAMELLRERTHEMEKLMQQGEEIPDEVVARMSRHLSRAMSQAAWTPEEEMPGLLQRMATRLQEQQDKLEELQIRAREQVKNQTQLQTAQQACEQAQQQAADGVGDPQTFRERHQDREGQPDEATPPDAPSIDPPQGSGGQGPTGPGNPDGGQGRGGQ